MKLIASTDMKIVAMTEFKGRLYLACEHGVYIKDEDDKFHALELVERAE